MATRGRKFTPYAIKELEGNPDKRALNEREPKPEKKAPSCPKWLEPEAKKEWRRLAKKREALGVFSWGRWTPTTGRTSCRKAGFWHGPSFPRGGFKKGLFRGYFGSAIRKRLVNIYRSYTLKNFVCIDEQVDCRGNVTKTMVESDYARAYREKHREQCSAWYAKKKASQPPREAKPKMTIDEKRAKAAAYQRAYKEAHPEKYERRKAMERERQRRKAAERRAARMATA